MRIALSICLALVGFCPVTKAQPYQYQISASAAPVKMQSPQSYDLPPYPLKAKAQRLQGSGRFEITVLPNGSVDSVRVSKSTGHSVLDEAGVTTLRKWRFPRGAPKIIRVPIVWTLGTIKEYAPKHRWRDPKSLGVGDGEWIIISER